jgi:hypothetical protein
MKHATVALCGLAGIGALVLMGPAGCERSEDTTMITVRPNPVEITAPNTAVLLTATGGLRALSLPLTWSVSNPAFGTIDPVYRGETAVYVSGTNSRCVNLVTVVDQYGAEGYATITQNYISNTNSTGDTVLDVVASPGTIPGGANTSTITVRSPTNALPPFTWFVGDANYGNVAFNVTTSTNNTYTSTGAGQNTVYVSDAAGRNGRVTIEAL